MGRALVVGGNGFLGAHLVDALVADGSQVDVVDRCSTSAATASLRSACGGT